MEHCIVRRGVVPAHVLHKFTPPALAQAFGREPVLVREYKEMVPEVSMTLHQRWPEFMAWSGTRKRQIVLHNFPLARDSFSQIKRAVGAGEGEVTWRISRTPWQFGAHFDCCDNWLVQLYGERRIVLAPLCSAVRQDDTQGHYVYGMTPHELRKRALAREVLLKAGDAVFFPAMTVHAVDAKKSTPVSVACTLSGVVQDGMCKALFRELHPGRITEAHLERQ